MSITFKLPSFEEYYNKIKNHRENFDIINYITEKCMNKLILLGNGFDLAHDLKTKYSDFIIWYLNKVYEGLCTNHEYEDDLISAYTNYKLDFNEVNSVIEFRNIINLKNFNITYKNSFFEKLLYHFSDKNWVDIEASYYTSLLEYYKLIEKGHDIYSIESKINKLNKTLEAIKKFLEEYLIIIERNNQSYDDEIHNHLEDIFTDCSPDYTAYFLNFNYTSTVKRYINSLHPSCKVITNHIHGKLSDPSNPLIFGYGDEMDPYYQKIEVLQINEFLKHFKSFYYFKTQYYQHLISFIEHSGKFKVYIIGHSCGTSDRVLLNSIFENRNCNGIEILYHQKNKSENDFFEKTMEISRHFRPELKNKMRTLIVPEDKSKPLKKCHL